MNFKNNEKSIRKLLLLPNRRKTQSKDPKKAKRTVPTFYRGIYVISRREEDDVHKIGMAHGAGGLFTRLKDYKLCFPFKDEFWVNLLITTPTAADAKKLERVVLKHNRFRNVEAHETAQGRRSLEYRITGSRASLNQAVMDALNKSPNQWTNVIVLNKWGWRVIENTGKVITGLSRPSQGRTTMKGLFGAPPVRAPKAKTKKTKKVKPKKVKKNAPARDEQADMTQALLMSLEMNSEAQKKKREERARRRGS